MAEIIFPGIAGHLQGHYLDNGKDSPIALIMHPHPMHGGNMYSKPVHTLYHAFAQRQFSVLRFNFRGVGRSEGSYDHGKGEVKDAIAALNWLQSQHKKNSPIWISGFSFGAWIGMQLTLNKKEVSNFIALGTPAGLFNITLPTSTNGILIHGQDDQLIPYPLVADLHSQWQLSNSGNTVIEMELIPNSDHFFTNQLSLLNQFVGRYIDNQIKDELYR